MPHWNGGEGEAWRSRGRGVLYLADPRDNLVLTAAQRAAWPLGAPRKRSASARRSWFDDEAWNALRGSAASPSLMQSVRSEDAATWSLFGPLLDAGEAARARFL